MAYGTITQPVFWVDTPAELSPSWPDMSLAWSRSDKRLYELSSGVWEMVNDMALVADWIPRIWVGKARKSLVKEINISGTVGSSGNVTFDLTDITNTALFSTVYKESANFWIDSAVSYNFSNYTLASDKKSLTVKVSNPILSALVIVYANAPSGTVVNLTIKGE